METPPEKSTARELTEQALVAGAGMVPTSTRRDRSATEGVDRTVGR